MGKTEKKNFTVKFLESLRPKEKRYNMLDGDTRGLAICVFPSGTKSFFHVRKVQGWPQRTTLGVFPEYTLDIARGKASELNGKLAKWKSDDYQGSNPIEKPKSVPTLGEVLEHYVENHLKTHAKNPDHAVWYARWQFDSYLASWRNRPLSTIRREHVRERHAEIAEAHGAVTANRTITFLRTIFNHAIHPDICLWQGINPAKDPKKFLAAEMGRDRVLEGGKESQVFFKELLKGEPNLDLRDAVLLAVFTGQRRGSILKMRWQDLDLRTGLWTVTTFKGKKGTEAHIVPLTDEALAVLRRRPRIVDSEWVFPGRNGALTTLKKPWAQFIKRTGITDLTFHDLRRSLATAEGDTGAATEVIQKTLGHVENSAATKIYDRSQRRPEVRQAMKKAVRRMLRAGKVTKRELLAAPRG
jgi:integrase